MNNYHDDYVSIVIPVLNRPHYLKRLLDSIHEHADFPYEIIIHDDSSDKETRDFLDSIRDQVSVIILNNGHQLGLGLSANRAISMTTSKYIIFMNADCMINRPFFKEIVSVLNKPYIGWIDLLETATDDRCKVIYADNNTGFVLKSGIGSGAAFAFSKHNASDFGFFDEDVRSGCVDSTFQYRSWAHGYLRAQLLGDPPVENISLKERHNQDSTMGKCVAHGTKVFTRNGLRNIESITYNDVISDGFVLKNVKERFFTGTKFVVKIRTRHGREILITPDSRMLVKSGDSFLYKKVDDLIIGDQLIAPIGVCTYDDNQSLNAKDYEIGFLTAATALSSVFLKEQDKMEYRLDKHVDYNKVIEILKKYFSDVSVKKCDNKIYISMARNKITDIIRKNISRYYEIPDKIKQSNFETICGFLSYVMSLKCVQDISNDIIRFSTSIKSFAKDIQLLLQYIGISASLKIRNASTVDLIFDDESERLKLLDLLNHEYTRQPNSYIVDPIKYIISYNYVSTYDMHVEDDHSYIANGLIIHNSGFDCSAQKVFGLDYDMMCRRRWDECERRFVLCETDPSLIGNEVSDMQYWNAYSAKIVNKDGTVNFDMVQAYFVDELKRDLC